MLERLTITDFAVARSVTLEPGPGLNVFTGETGAGKSLVVDALAFVFGARRGREVIATGAERATVSALVRDGDATLELERTIGLAGRSSARVDGAPSTVDALQELGARLVDIHGQSEQLAILRPAVQLAALDSLAGLDRRRQEFAAGVRELREVRRSLRSLASDSRERERRVEQLQFEADEIGAVELRPGEDEDLRGEQARLASAGRLREEAAAALEALDSASLDTALGAVTALTGLDPGAADLASAAAGLEAASAELRRMLRQYADTIEEDPECLAAVQDRLDRIARLRRKYGETVEEILAYGTAASEELAALRSSGLSAESLAAHEADLAGQLSAQAQDLSAARRAAAGNLVRAIAAEVERLGMPNASLSVGFGCEDAEDGLAVALPDYEVVITEREQPGANDTLRRAFTESGVDRMELLASFNPGETPRPLGAIASGGETSRFLLALATVLGSATGPRIVVFDEVDEGVGGRAGGLVGEALSRLSRQHQVLCVTHLPQVAAHAARHFVVTKSFAGELTASRVTRAEGDARVAELAAMFGGDTEANRAAARELLDARLANAPA